MEGRNPLAVAIYGEYPNYRPVSIRANPRGAAVSVGGGPQMRNFSGKITGLFVIE